MARRSNRRQQQSEDDSGETETVEQPQQQQQPVRSVAAHVRDRQRAVAEREAARLARPERRAAKKLEHADRKKSAVSSTPFGILNKREKDEGEETTQGWCGPFSVARQMINKREEARRKREKEQEEEDGTSHPLDELVDQVALEKKRKAHPSLLWKSQISDGTSSSSSLYAKRQKRVDRVAVKKSIPSLFDLCIDFLVTNFEYVECLGDVDSSIRSTVAKELVARKKLDEAAFEAIAEPGIEALEMVDCAEVSQEQLTKALKKLLPAGLRYLVLDQCGRCFGPNTVQAMLPFQDSCELFALSVGGAYLLKDDDAAKLLEAFSSTLSSIEFKACQLLGDEFCKSLGDNFSSGGKLLELSLEDLNFSNENLSALISAGPKALQYVKSLTLRSIGGLNDAVVVKLLEIVGDSLEALDLSHNYELTDLCLSPLRKFNPYLRSLHLTGLKYLTAAGLEALFTHGLEDLGPPPMLRSLNLASCDHEAVTDEVMELVLRAASRKRDGTSDSLSLLGGIVSLDIQGSSVVSDTTMENLVATSSTSLQELNVSFCSKITDQGLGYLVDKTSIQLTKIQIWGCAQITDQFLDGHSRVNDAGLDIEGAWMKKSGTMSLR